MRLTTRLETCLHYTEGFQKLADIGTDHAMLPIEAVLRGNVLYALAIDNKFGPFMQARTNVRKYQVDSRVKVLLGDGLDKIDDDVDVVVISGMGGGSIADILTKGDRKKVKRFVLQPNTQARHIRAIAEEIGCHIAEEFVLEDQDVLYEVLVLDIGQQHYGELEIEYGPINLRDRPYYFLQKVRQDLAHYQSILKQVTTEERQIEIKKKITELEAILHEG